jgi:hypothetical protein
MADDTLSEDDIEQLARFFALLAEFDFEDRDS